MSNDLLTDKRIIERNIKRGRLDAAEYRSMLDALPDLRGQLWQRPERAPEHHAAPQPVAAPAPAPVAAAPAVAAPVPAPAAAPVHAYAPPAPAAPDEPAAPPERQYSPFG